MCALLAVVAGVNPRPARADHPSPVMVISAMLPNPSHGPEWVMLENRDTRLENKPFKVFLPVMHLRDSDLPSETVGPPPAPSFIEMDGWRLGRAGQWYFFPSDMPPVPLGANVKVYFDGLGEEANDYNFSDGVAELHTPAGLTNVFPDTKGKVFLYAGDVSTPANLRAQYEWGVGILDVLPDPVPRSEKRNEDHGRSRIAD